MQLVCYPPSLETVALKLKTFWKTSLTWRMWHGIDTLRISMEFNLSSQVSARSACAFLPNTSCQLLNWVPSGAPFSVTARFYGGKSALGVSRLVEGFGASVSLMAMGWSWLFCLSIEEFMGGLLQFWFAPSGVWIRVHPWQFWGLRFFGAHVHFEELCSSL